MTHLKTSPSNKNWLQTLYIGASNLQVQITNLSSNTLYANTQSLLGNRSKSVSNNQFITTREAEILSKYVNRSSDMVYVNAIGGSTAYFFTKRIIDLFLASILIGLLLPVLLLCALWVAINNGGLVFNRQEEFTSKLINKDGKYVWVVVPFARYEFLTSRQTLSGQLMQKTGLAALPTLFSVLRGEMSIVGSETMTQQDLDSFADWQFLSLACKPGIIGISRISGKFSWLTNDRNRQEVWYACNQSCAVDIKILFTTFCTILTTSV